MKYVAGIILFVFLSATLLSFQNCAPQKFDNAPAASQDASSPAATAGTPAPNGSASGTIHQSAAELPKISFVGPPCTRGTACAAAFQLDKAMPFDVSFDWRTNDTLYTTPVPAGQPIYGQPNVHYVPTAGTALMKAGSTSFPISIQNINPYNISIVIGVVMTNCYYGNDPIDCSTAFH